MSAWVKSWNLGVILISSIFCSFLMFSNFSAFHKIDFIFFRMLLFYTAKTMPKRKNKNFLQQNLFHAGSFHVSFFVKISQRQKISNLFLKKCTKNEKNERPLHVLTFVFFRFFYKHSMRNYNSNKIFNLYSIEKAAVKVSHKTQGRKPYSSFKKHSQSFDSDKQILFNPIFFATVKQ